MSEPLLKAGLCAAASAAFRSIGLGADRIGRVIHEPLPGEDDPSAGYHAHDGAENGHPYTAATDLRIGGWDDAALRTWLDKLGTAGFAAFYRRPGRDGWPAGGARHVHAVFAGVAMKAHLRAQVHDYCHVPMRNGLASHAEYGFWQPSASETNRVRALFLAHNPP